MTKVEQKIRKSVQLLKSGKPTQEVIGVLYRMTGFFRHRMYFGYKTKKYSDKLRVDEENVAMAVERIPGEKRFKLKVYFPYFWEYPKVCVNLQTDVR